MNVIALLSAAIGVSLLGLIVFLGNKIANRWLRYLTAVIGVFVAIVAAGSIPALLGDPDMSTSSTAGAYVLYLGILVAIVNSIFFKKKKITEGDQPAQI